jgi:molecular chaperone DnaK
VKQALQGTDSAAIKAATEALTQVFYGVSQKLYQQQGGQPGGPDMGGMGGMGGDAGAGAAPGAGPQDDVFNADYKVMDDDK